MSIKNKRQLHLGLLTLNVMTQNSWVDSLSRLYHETSLAGHHLCFTRRN